MRGDIPCEHPQNTSGGSKGGQGGPQHPFPKLNSLNFDRNCQKISEFDTLNFYFFNRDPPPSRFKFPDPPLNPCEHPQHTESCLFTANITRWPIAVLMLGHRLRRWPNIKTTSDQCISCVDSPPGERTYLCNRGKFWVPILVSVYIRGVWRSP